jgi:hypothetical protein
MFHVYVMDITVLIIDKECLDEPNNCHLLKEGPESSSSFYYRFNETRHEGLINGVFAPSNFNAPETVLKSIKFSIYNRQTAVTMLHQF